MPTFLKIIFPVIIILLLHFFYLNGKKLMKSQTLYRLEKVAFIGVEESDPYEIIRFLGLEKGINLLFLDTGELTDKIKTMVRYKNAEVFLQYPDTLILKLEEKKPEFLLRVSGKMYTIDRYGEITEHNNKIKNHDLFFIEAVDFQNVEQVLTNPKMISFLKYARSFPESEKNIFEIFSGIEFSPYNRDWILSGHTVKVKFNLGKNLTFNKLRKTRYALVYGDYKNISTGNIFITDNLVYFNQ